MKPSRTNAPIHLIAQELGLSVRTVQNDYRKVVAKLKRQRAFGVTEEQDVLQTGSLECLVASKKYIP